VIPEIQYLTNDSWELVSGMTQNDLGYPLLIQAGYAKGSLYVLTIPENFSDLYSVPPEVLTQIRNVLLRDLFVRVESPGDVSLLVYDNNTFAGGFGGFGTGGGNSVFCPVEIRPHSYRVFSALPAQ